MKLYLQHIIESIQNSTLPAEWQGFDLESFSKSKRLFDYQQKALENSIKALWLFYEECKGDKEAFYNKFKDNGLVENLDFDLKKDGSTSLTKSKAIPYLQEFENDYRKSKIDRNTEYKSKKRILYDYPTILSQPTSYSNFIELDSSR